MTNTKRQDEKTFMAMFEAFENLNKEKEEPIVFDRQCLSYLQIDSYRYRKAFHLMTEERKNYTVFMFSFYFYMCLKQVYHVELCDRENFEFCLKTESGERKIKPREAIIGFFYRGENHESIYGHLMKLVSKD